jgi:hypothetical protein
MSIKGQDAQTARRLREREAKTTAAEKSAIAQTRLAWLNETNRRHLAEAKAAERQHLVDARRAEELRWMALEKTYPPFRPEIFDDASNAAASDALLAALLREYPKGDSHARN